MITSSALPDWIPAAFDEYKELTGGNAEAAATLVLAQAVASEPPSEPGGMFDVRQAARRLRVSDTTIRGLVRSGQLPVTRIGTGRGVLRFSPDDVIALAKGRAEKTLPRSDSAKRRRLLGVG